MPERRPVVACLDTWAPAVCEVVRRTAPAEFELRFAESYDEAHQCMLAADADFLLPGWAAVSAEMLAGAHRLRLIQKWGIGIDRIDVDAARDRGIALAITAGSNAAPVAELAIALMLAVYRRIPYVNRVMRHGEWPKAAMRETCFQIAGKRVGIVGFGNIGRMLAKRLSGFDCDIVYADARRASVDEEAKLNARHVTLAELLGTSDIISLHAPFTADTARMIDAAAIASMKDGAILINTARGELVDEAALHAALLSGKLRGAGLDAFDPEPPSADNPLFQLDQVVITPHAGGGVFDNVENVARHAFGNMLRVMHGEALAPADVVIPVAARAAGAKGVVHV